MNITNSQIFKTAFVDKTNSLSSYIFDNANAIIDSCIEQSSIARKSRGKQEEYEKLIDNGYGFTIETTNNFKGKAVFIRIRSLRNEWTAIKFIGENPNCFREWFSNSENRKLKVVTLRGIVNAVKIKSSIRKTTQHTFEALLSKFKRVVSDQGDDWSAFLKFANLDVSRKVKSVNLNVLFKHDIKTDENAQCVDCLDEIPKDRLRAMPGAKRCLVCADSFENNNYNTNTSYKLSEVNRTIVNS